MLVGVTTRGFVCLPGWDMNKIDLPSNKKKYRKVVQREMEIRNKGNDDEGDEMRMDL